MEKYENDDVSFEEIKSRIISTLPRYHKKLLQQIVLRQYLPYQYKYLKEDIDSTHLGLLKKIKSVKKVDEIGDVLAGEAHLIYLLNDLEDQKEKWELDTIDYQFKLIEFVNKLSNGVDSDELFDLKEANKAFKIDSYQEFEKFVETRTEQLNSKTERLEFLIKLKNAIASYLNKDRNSHYTEVLLYRGGYCDISWDLDIRTLAIFLELRIESEKIILTAKDKIKLKRSILNLKKERIVFFEPLDSFISSNFIVDYTDINRVRQKYSVIPYNHVKPKRLINSLIKLTNEHCIDFTKQQLKFWLYSILSDTEGVTYSMIHDAIFLKNPRQRKP